MFRRNIIGVSEGDLILAAVKSGLHFTPAIGAAALHPGRLGTRVEKPGRRARRRQPFVVWIFWAVLGPTFWNGPFVVGRAQNGADFVARADALGEWQDHPGPPAPFGE